MERQRRIARTRAAPPPPPDPPDPSVTPEPDLEVYETPAEELRELKTGDAAEETSGRPSGAAADKEAGR